MELTDDDTLGFEGVQTMTSAERSKHYTEVAIKASALAACEAFDAMSASAAYGGGGATSVLSRDLNALEKAIAELRATISGP